MGFPLIGAIASIASGILGNNSAKKASKAQMQVAREQMALTERITDRIDTQLAPWRAAGGNALAAYQYNLGLGQKPQNYAGFAGSPGYAWAKSQGQSAIDNSAASRGNLFSGATLKAQNKYGTGMAQQDWNNHLSNLYGLSSSGQNATNAGANNYTNFLSQQNQNLAGYGNAASAGAIGQGNAWSDMLGNLTGVMSYQNASNGGLFNTTGGGFNGFNVGNLFGGGSWG
jgi:hypothetical protein